MTAHRTASLKACNPRTPDVVIRWTEFQVRSVGCLGDGGHSSYWNPDRIFSPPSRETLLRRASQDLPYSQGIPCSFSYCTAVPLRSWKQWRDTHAQPAPASQDFPHLPEAAPYLTMLILYSLLGFWLPCHLCGLSKRAACWRSLPPFQAQKRTPLAGYRKGARIFRKSW